MPKKKVEPETLLQLFSEDYPELLEQQFCDCHQLSICPTAWMYRKESDEA